MVRRFTMLVFISGSCQAIIQAYRKIYQKLIANNSNSIKNILEERRLMAQIQQLRSKIKKLKYKLEKQQKINSMRKQQVQHLSALNQQDVSIERVMKKISVMLSYKGMTLRDWLMALNYKEKQYLDNYLDLLQKMGVRLDQREKSVLINFMTGDLTEKVTYEQVSQLASSAGVRME